MMFRCSWIAGVFLAWNISASEGLGAPAVTLDIGDVARPAFRLFNDRDGLPQNTIEAIGTDRKNYLWIGTQNGAVVYNGHSWKVYDMPQRNISNWVRALLPASDGSIWFGRDDGGVARYKDGRWDNFDQSSGLPNNRVSALLETRGGGRRQIVAGTGAGVAFWEGDHWSTPPRMPAPLARGVTAATETVGQSGESILWFGTEHGLVRYDGEQWQVFGVSDGLPSMVINGLLGVRGDDGLPVLFIGTLQGMAVLSHGQWTSYHTAQGLPAESVTRFAELPLPGNQRGMLVGTEGGIAVFHDGVFRQINMSSGFPNQIIRSLAVTQYSGGKTLIWAGTFGGLIRFANGSWSTFDMQSYLPDNVVFATLDSPSTGSFWVGTFGGVARFHEGKWEVFDRRRGLIESRTFSLLETHRRDGRSVIWVGLRGGGVAAFEDGKWTIYDQRQGLPDNWVYSLLETQDGKGGSVIWAGTRKGLAWLEAGEWKHFTEKDGFPAVLVTALLASKTLDGRPVLWACTRGNGVARHQDGQWEFFDYRQGLVSGRVSELLELKCANGRRRLLAGTLEGAFTLEMDRPGARWEPFRPLMTLGTTKMIYSLKQDTKGRIYLFTNQGVVQLTPKSTPGKAWDDFDIYWFTTGDGLPSNGCTQNSSMVDQLGRVWTGTVAGVTFFDPSNTVADHTAKPLYIERTTVSGWDFPLAGASLAHSQRGVVVEYALLGYFREQDTLYRTQLMGLEDNPSPWVPDGKREYPSLPAGVYTFQVWGKDYAGNVSGPVQVSFRVNPAPWLTPLAYAGYVILLGLAMAGIIRWRMLALQQRNLQLKRLVRERTLELEAANVALKDQALTDPLTGLRNRRYLALSINETLAQAIRTRQDVESRKLDRIIINTDIAFLMVDLDHFKEINDQFGHSAGDQVLVQVAGILRFSTRATDTVIRWGGEEFLVVARSTARNDVATLAERIRFNVGKHEFVLDSEGRVHRTCSVGFASFPFITGGPGVVNWEKVVEMADQCLFAAKRGGRNLWVGVLPTDLYPAGWDSRGEFAIRIMLGAGLVRVVTNHPNIEDLQWEK